MPFNSDQLMRPPQYWRDQLPNPDDYDTIEEYNAAVEAGSYLNSPPLGGYYNEGTGEWIGGRQTEAEYAARKANQMLNPSFNAGLGGMGLRLDSAMKTKPDEMAAAYGAWDEQGNPLVNDVVLSLMEQYGFRPTPVGGAVGGDVPPVDPAPPPWTPPGFSGTPGISPPDVGELPPGGGIGTGNTNGNSPFVPPGFSGTPGMSPPDVGTLPDGGIGTGNTGMGGAPQAATWDIFYNPNPPPIDPNTPQLTGVLTANEPVAGIPPDTIQRIRQRYRRFRPQVNDPLPQGGYGY